MVEADFSGSYLNADNCKDKDAGSIAVFEGKDDCAYYEEKKSMKGTTYRQMNICIDINGKKLIFSPGMLNGKELVKAWGRDTKKWIGKKLQAVHVAYQSPQGRKTKVDIQPI